MPQKATNVTVPCPGNEFIKTLSRLLLSADGVEARMTPAAASILNIERQEFESLISLANLNHVVIRGVERFRGVMAGVGDELRIQWADAALAAERGRIAHSLEYLNRICGAFGEAGLDVTVIKSLDHWPDMGSDLDLYTNAPADTVCAMMRRQFGAEMEERSWGDHLAGKWNFKIPDLPELVEVHIGRLGQTGEQKALASRLPGRARTVEIAGHRYPVPSATDRLLVSTLQRMYRHFYVRLCDILDVTELVRSGDLDYEDLRKTAETAGVWDGVATYLAVVSDYVRTYGGGDIGLPTDVMKAARFRGDRVYFQRNFWRFPILPQSAELYRTQLAGLLRNRALYSSARLGLLPWLATAAAIGQKISGSDKGIW